MNETAPESPTSDKVKATLLRSIDQKAREAGQAKTSIEKSAEALKLLAEAYAVTLWPKDHGRG
jgi:hypothetical protein